MPEGEGSAGTAYKGAAKGMAPSVIPTQPMASAAFPASFSSEVYFFGTKNVASAMPSGGIQTAAAEGPA